ncbi:MAG: ADP-ribosyl-[dinitrogen reductase] hydrolase [Gammaproteobacteria bacterium]|nr:ADP-ribosyl-[dinitrogen reductase] hydrolase [Gammaproteobacteria bacterium]
MAAAAQERYEACPENKAIGAYLGLAVGDALGATVEFMPPAKIKALYGVHESITGGGWLGLKPGQVTDDTLMSLVLGESILKKGAVDASAVAQSFSDWFVNNPVDIGKTVKRGIIHYRYSGTPYVAENSSDAGNGACMRTLPVALATYGLSDEINVKIASRDQAHVTHNNPLSDAATECVIQMIHAGLTGCDKYDIKHGPVKQLLNRFPEFNYFEIHREMPSGYIVETMQVVLQAFFTTDSFEDCLINVVNRGGDADTTGAIAGMIAGCYYGLEAIPARWLSQLDHAVADACELQARALLALEYGKAVSA